MADGFAWVSPLGLATALFLAAGSFQVLIGALTTAYVAKGGRGNAFFFTERSDASAFGVAPRDLAAAHPGLDRFRRLVWLSWAAFLLAVGLLEAGIAWFALRAGAPWALPLLGSAAVVLAVCWAAVVAGYLRAGAKVGLGDIPPFMWVPAVLHAPAIALAWSALG